MSLNSSINYIIHQLPFDRIENVYPTVVGDRVISILLEGNSRTVEIDFVLKLKHELKIKSSKKIYYLRKSITPEAALDLLTSIDYDEQTRMENVQIGIDLLELNDFKPIKDELKKEFHFWLLEKHREDNLIGNLAKGLRRDKDITELMDYNKLKQHLINKTIGHWDIHTLEECKTKKGSVSPVLCLKIAKMEYDAWYYKQLLNLFNPGEQSGYIYFFKPEGGDKPIKIGKSKCIPDSKEKFQDVLPFDLDLVGRIGSDDCINLENQITERLQPYHIKKGWYDIEADLAKTMIKEIRDDWWLRNKCISRR